MARTKKGPGVKAEDLRKSVENLAAVIATDAGDETFEKYLEFLARFHDYSAHNVCLILWQRPEATYVAGYRRWQKLGRQVRKGEKGAGILVPFFPRKRERAEDEDELDEDRKPVYFGVGHVFDIAQTDPTDEAGVDFPPNFSPDLTGDVETLWKALVAFAAEEGITVETKPLYGPRNGYADVGRRVATINSERTVGVQWQTLVHEVAHIDLGHGPGTKLSHAVVEGEADAVRVVVLKALGIDAVSNGAAYLRAHGATEKEVLGSLERIAATARKVLAGQDAHVHEVDVSLCA